MALTFLIAATACPLVAQTPAQPAVMGPKPTVTLPAAGAAEPQLNANPARQSTESKLETIYVTMEFRDVEMQEVIRMIAEKARLNVLFDPLIVAGGKITLKLENVKLSIALDNILKTRGLAYVVHPEDNILRVIRATMAGQTGIETITEVRPLKYLYAPRAAKNLMELFTPAKFKREDSSVTMQHSQASGSGKGGAAASAGASSWTPSTVETGASNAEESLIAISYHLEANALILVAPPYIMVKMNDLIDKLDKKENAPPEPITKIVEINWMDADDLVVVLTRVFVPSANSATLDTKFSGGNGSLITVSKAAGTPKGITDSGGKDSDKQVKTRLAGLEENVLSGFGLPSNTNAVVLTAPPVIMDEMLKMIKTLDVPQKQVQIEARLVEMNETASRLLGSTLALTGTGSISEVKLLNGQAITQGLTSTFGKNITIFGQAYDLAGTLQAYESRQMLTTLANPRVVTLNKQSASISFVKEIPYITYTVSNGVSTPSVNFKNAGVDIGVLPIVTQAGSVNMAIGVTQGIHTGYSETTDKVPIINRRQVQGQVIANSGDTIVMGGLRTMDLSDVATGTPWLHQVPVLGWLFKSKTNKAEKSEMFIFVTPRVLDDVIASPEQKIQYDKIDTKWHVPDYFYDDVKTDVDRN